MLQLFWNETFYRRISPTSFYSMMAKAPTDDQATKMVNNWLHSPEHFCIAPNGDFAGNKDTCYWGLPSIEASDPAFPPLGYWRGYVWSEKHINQLRRRLVFVRTNVIVVVLISGAQWHN
jgi:hypothetical protein